MPKGSGVAAGLGFEPRRAAPKTAVLPLDDPAASGNYTGSVAQSAADLVIYSGSFDLRDLIANHRSELIHRFEFIRSGREARLAGNKRAH